jgi:hypothetical protein
MTIRGLIERRLVELARRFARETRTGAQTTNEPQPPDEPTTSASTPNEARDEDTRPTHADERTIRRMGEAEHGGRSTEDSRKAYERGDTPGGLHGGVRRPRPSRE